MGKLEIFWAEGVKDKPVIGFRGMMGHLDRVDKSRDQH